MTLENAIGISRVLDRIIAKARSQEWLSRGQKKHSLIRDRDDFLLALSMPIRTPHFTVNFNLRYRIIEIRPKTTSFTFEMCDEFMRELEQVRTFCEWVESYWEDLTIFLDDEYIRVCDEIRSTERPSALLDLGATFDLEEESYDGDDEN